MKVWILTLAFANTTILERSVQQLHATRSSLVSEHVLIHQHYPLPSKLFVDAQVSRIAKDYGCRLLDPGYNMGLHDGWNWACQQLPLEDDDVLIGYDSDSYPLTQNWDQALLDAIHASDEIVWASLTNHRSEHELSAILFTELHLNGVRLYSIHTPIINSICAIRWSFLKKVGGLQEMTKFYGHLETEMWGKIKNNYKAWVFLPDYKDSDILRDTHDTEYKDYKDAHARTHTWENDFDSYLLEKYPLCKF